MNKRLFPHKLAWAVLSLALLTVCGCRCQKEETKPAAGTASSPAKAGEPVILNGAGLELPLIAEHARENPNAQVHYAAIGSVAGIRQMVAGSIDLAVTDVPMNADELTGARYKVVQVPVALSAVALVCNVGGVNEMKLSPETLAGIYLGEIKNWNDKKIAADNPGITLPNQDVNSVFRSDDSGTTLAFTDYLSKVSAAFKEKVGSGTSVRWLAGLGAKGNDGVTGQLKTVPGAIGYVDFSYAMQNGMPMAALKNHSAELVAPSLTSIAAAAADVALPAALTLSITDSPEALAYPISLYTYVIVRQESENASKGEAVADFLSWVVHADDKRAAALNHARLSGRALAQVETAIKGLTRRPATR